MDDKKWLEKPMRVYSWQKDVHYAMFMDENGSAESKSILKAINNNKQPNENDRYLNITSVLTSSDSFFDIRNRFINIKNEFWKNGEFYDSKTDSNKTVLLHTKDINNGHGAFDRNVVDRNKLFVRITKEIEKSQMIITNSFVDKYNHFLKYEYAEDPYFLAVKHIMETLVTIQTNDNDKIIIMLEGRGKKEDRELLSNIRKVLEFGTNEVKQNSFNKIVGVYFNPKRPPIDDSKTFIGLEIADLCAYPIYKYCRYGTKDANFNSIEGKILGYPNYEGIGIKRFP